MVSPGFVRLSVTALLPKARRSDVRSSSQQRCRILLISQNQETQCNVKHGRTVLRPYHPCLRTLLEFDEMKSCILHHRSHAADVRRKVMEEEGR